MSNKILELEEYWDSFISTTNKWNEIQKQSEGVLNQFTSAIYDQPKLLIPLRLAEKLEIWHSRADPKPTNALTVEACLISLHSYIREFEEIVQQLQQNYEDFTKYLRQLPVESCLDRGKKCCDYSVVEVADWMEKFFSMYLSELKHKESIIEKLSHTVDSTTLTKSAILWRLQPNIQYDTLHYVNERIMVVS